MAVNTIGAGVILNEGQIDVDLRVEGNSNANVLMVDGSTDRVGIGTATPSAHLEVVGGTDYAQIKLTDTDSDDTVQRTGIICQHYDGDGNEQDIRMIGMYNSNTTNNVQIGGGSGDHNSAELIQFFVSDNHEQLTGTIRMVIDSNSRISLSNNDSGSYNTVFGKLAGAALASGGDGNLFIGENAGNDVTTADYNIAIGYQAFSQATDDCDKNIVIGVSAMSGNIGSNDVSECVAIGHEAMDGVLTSDATGTIGIGYQALTALTSGQRNTAIGYTALAAEQQGDYSVAIGFESLVAQTGTDGTAANTAVGYNSGASITSGTHNTLIGYLAGDGFDAENQNVAIGAGAMGGAVNGADACVVIGYDAMTGAATQDGTVAIGKDSLQSLTSGNNNLAVGFAALAACTTSGQNTAVGYQALTTLVDGGGNTAFGHHALKSGTHTDLNNNTIIGAYAGDAFTNAAIEHTVAVGANALGGAIEAAANGSVAIGSNACLVLTSGAGNVAIGYSSQVAMVGGSYNASVGYESLDSDTNGSRSVAIGYAALQAQNFASATDCYNTAVGFHAGYANASGQNNTFIGGVAGDTPSSGSNNTCIGQGSDVSNNANQIAVGYAAVATAANETIWGNASNTPNNITNDWTVTSDKRIKKDIEDSDIGLSFVNSLRARKFKRKHPSEWDAEILEERYKRGGGNYDDEKDEVIKDEFDEEKVWNGLIAQEVKESMDELGVEFSGWNESSNSKQGIQYSTMVVPLIKAVQELSQQVEDLKKKVGE